MKVFGWLSFLTQILTILFPQFCFSFSFDWKSNISSTQDRVLSHNIFFQKLWSTSKILCYGLYFQLSSWSLVMWSTMVCVWYSCFEKGCPTKAWKRLRQCQLALWVERGWRWLIEIHGVYQQEKSRHKYICLCCFPLCHWNTLNLNQGPWTPITHNTFQHCCIQFSWTTFHETAAYFMNQDCSLLKLGIAM